MVETSSVLRQVFRQKFPERDKNPPRCVWDDGVRRARAAVSCKAREPKWLEREDPRVYSNLQSLRRAVLKCDEHAIMSCAKNGVDLNKPFPDGGGPALVEVASRGDMQLTKMLLEIKAQPASGNAQGYSPLMAAIDRSHWEVAGVLLARLEPKDLGVTMQKSKYSAFKAAAQRRDIAETEREELARIILRGEIAAHVVSSVVQKLENAKAERERASLFLQDLLQVVEDHQKELFEFKIESSKKASTSDGKKVVKIEETDPANQEVSYHRSSFGSEGRWWLKFPSGDKGVKMKDPRSPAPL